MSDIELLKAYYGFNTKDAKFYRKSITNQTMEQIRKYEEAQAKRSFYED